MHRTTVRIGVMHRTAFVRTAVAALCGLGLAACEEPVTPSRAPDHMDPNLAVGSGARVEVTPTNPTVGLNATLQLKATVYDATGRERPGTYVYWHSSNWSVARVSGSGLVTGATRGTSVITAATLTGLKGTATVTVGDVTEEPPPPPTSGTVISPGESIQAKVDANPAGTAFVLKAGVHRLQQVRPKSGNTFAGEPGAVLSGARLLTAFAREGGYWVAAGQTQDGADQATPPAGLCRAGYPRCHRPEDLFVDDVPLRHVGTLGEVGPGRWYFDYAADKIYFADDPAGRRVEASVTRHAFVGTADGVTIRGLVIEKYANPTQQGAVSPGAYQQSGGRDWVIEDNTVRLTHGEGIRIGERARVRRNRALRNGQLGMGGFGSGALVEGNEVAFNNWAGVEPEFAAGGAKFHGTSGYVTRDLVVRDNRVHDNAGHALWCDFNCVGTVYEGNVVENNTGWGVFHEISGSAVVRHNTLRGNGGGVFVSTSQGVEVHGNTIAGPAPIFALDQTRGTGAFGTLLLADLWVHDNVVTVTGGTVGVIQTSGTNAAFTSRNVRFDRNTYYLSAPTARAFSWANGTLTAAEWRAHGLDPNGIFR